MVEVVLLVLLALEQALQLDDVLPGFAQAQRAEVGVKGTIDEILGSMHCPYFVDVEVE
jgi:hypothetical protein